MTVPAGSEQYMRSLETLTFPVWGNSDNIAPNGQPGRHMGPGSGERLAEEIQSNLRFTVRFFTLECLLALNELKNHFYVVVCLSGYLSFP